MEFWGKAQLDGSGTHMSKVYKGLVQAIKGTRANG